LDDFPISALLGAILGCAKNSGSCYDLGLEVFGGPELIDGEINRAKPQAAMM
jgi:hypothetical protein